MSDNGGVYYPPAAGYGLYLLFRALYHAVKSDSASGRPAPAARPARAPIITPPPGRSSPVSPGAPDPPASPATLTLAWPIPESAPLVVPVEKWQRQDELLAWRFWGLGRLRADGGARLKSFRAPYAWDGPVLRAHRLPTESPFSRSGVYALKGPKECNNGVYWTDECWVSGWVALSGRVIEHEHGFRAERVVIRKLRLGVGTHLHLRRMDDVMALAAELEQRYQAPVDLGPFERRFAGGVLEARPQAWPEGVPDLPEGIALW